MDMLNRHLLSYTDFWNKKRQLTPTKKKQTNKKQKTKQKRDR